MWIKAENYIREFNGLVQYALIGRYEYGVFEETYGPKWTLRKRPVDKNNEALDSWGFPLFYFNTKKALISKTETFLKI